MDWAFWSFNIPRKRVSVEVKLPFIFAASSISAFVTHYLAKDRPKAFMPLISLVLLVISYVTRPASRQWHAKVTTA